MPSVDAECRSSRRAIAICGRTVRARTSQIPASTSRPCLTCSAEEFDRDPFLIFRMRGMDRGEFLTLLGEGSAPRSSSAPVLPPEPLPADPEAFWAVGELPEDVGASAPVQRTGAAIAKRLGKFPFWRGQGVLLDFLDRVYMETAAKTEETLARIRYEPKDS